MTRIFDALRKIQGTPMAPLPAPEAALPLPTPLRPARAATPALRPMIVTLAVAQPPPEEVAREMTSLRVRLEAELLDRAPRVVMFMGSHGGEGTSTVAAQFAFTLAGDRRVRVLLVDANARRPAFPDAAPGGDGGPGSTARPERLDLLPLAARHLGSGLIPATEARDAVEQFGPDYDWIVIDGPPALESPDAGALAAVADGTVVVVQAGRTKRPVLARAVELLRRTGARPMGVVLNRRRLEIPEFIYRRI
jgi:tyrosine-protein kinase